MGSIPGSSGNLKKRRPDASDAEFRAELRKADCLLTLIAHRHAVVCGDHDGGRHGAACPGTQKLAPAAADLTPDDMLKLSRYAAVSGKNPNRYFKNPLGGLGQYYLGVLRDDLGVLHGDVRTGVRYIHDIGTPVADDFADSVDATLFFSALDADEIDTTRLDQLATLCPCALADGHRP
jgi:hypothetical protein